MLSWVEHEKSFITSGPGYKIVLYVLIPLKTFYNMWRKELLQAKWHLLNYQIQQN